MVIQCTTIGSGSSMQLYQSVHACFSRLFVSDNGMAKLLVEFFHPLISFL